VRELGVRVGVVMFVVAMVMRCCECRAGKHDQQENGSENLFHTQNLARIQGCLIASHQESKQSSHAAARNFERKLKAQ
jgi:hypothetical protein